MKLLTSFALAVPLSVAALACAERATWDYPTPPAVDASEVLARLAPAKDGELVLANFWATW
jgi:hypothetical protein